MGWCVQCSGHVRGTLARGVLTDMRVRAVAVGTLGSYWGLIWLDALMRESVADSSESHPPPSLHLTTALLCQNGPGLSS